MESCPTPTGADLLLQNDEPPHVTLTFGWEPSLDDLLSDPMMRLLMRSDGVDERQLRDFIGELVRLRRRGKHDKDGGRERVGRR
ncbi:MAG: hypothetical protein K0R61_5304 [Microvirga sp.]|nr:hypothetical protein [Microvirga sp.]